jgi:predicted RNA-binding Zn-ribbon protein involved in translation (DUF1610 family)
MSHAACQSCNRHYKVGGTALDELYCPECKEEMLEEEEERKLERLGQEENLAELGQQRAEEREGYDDR